MACFPVLEASSCQAPAAVGSSTESPPPAVSSSHVPPGTLTQLHVQSWSDALYFALPPNTEQPELYLNFHPHCAVGSVLWLPSWIHECSGPPCPFSFTRDFYCSVVVSTGGGHRCHLLLAPKFWGRDIWILSQRSILHTLLKDIKPRRPWRRPSRSTGREAVELHGAALSREATSWQR